MAAWVRMPWRLCLFCEKDTVMQQRSHRATVMIHTDLRAFPGTIAPARRVAPSPSSLSGYGRVAANTLRFLLRHPIIVLTIAISCLLLVGSIGAAQEAARLDAQIAQARAQNEHINQQIAQTNALIVQLSQDNAIISAALKLGYVMPTSTSGGANP